jgi:hypothetical protein
MNVKIFSYPFNLFIFQKTEFKCNLNQKIRRLLGGYRPPPARPRALCALPPGIPPRKTPALRLTSHSLAPSPPSYGQGSTLRSDERPPAALDRGGSGAQREAGRLRKAGQNTRSLQKAAARRLRPHSFPHVTPTVITANRSGQCPTAAPCIFGRFRVHMGRGFHVVPRKRAFLAT